MTLDLIGDHNYTVHIIRHAFEDMKGYDHLQCKKINLRKHCLSGDSDVTILANFDYSNIIHNPSKP